MVTIRAYFIEADPRKCVSVLRRIGAAGCVFDVNGQTMVYDIAAAGAHAVDFTGFKLRLEASPEWRVCPFDETIDDGRGCIRPELWARLRPYVSDEDVIYAATVNAPVPGEESYWQIDVMGDKERFSLIRPAG